MFQWIIENKEWLFDGIGIIVISAIISLAIRFFNGRSSPPSVLYTKNDALWNEWLLPIIRTSRPQHAFLIEYSSANVKPLIDILLEYGWEVTLLMKNPDSDRIKWRKEKIKFGIEILERDHAEEILKKRLSIFLYSCPGSIRLRYLENIIVTLGWYTYDRRDAMLRDEQVWGHSNLLVSAKYGTQEWTEFKDFTFGVFERMKSDSISLSEFESRLP